MSENSYESPGSDAPSVSPNDSGKLPASLIVVAILFMLVGLASIAGTVVGLFYDRLFVDLNFLMLFAGIGLLHRRPGWRTFALVVTWIMLVSLPLLAALFSWKPEGVKMHAFGWEATHHAAAIGIAICGCMFALEVWIYRVLTRRDVHALFGPKTDGVESGDEE